MIPPNPPGAVPPARARYAEVARVLTRVLFANLTVAVAKIAVGYSSGAISILSDGFHSLTDTGSNIVGLVGVRAAARPPDTEHPYGHRKFETVAAAAIMGFLLLAVLEVLRNAINHLTGQSAPTDVSTAGLVVMVVTVGINILVVRYETREARRLESEVLLADAIQTRGDIWTSLAVIAALIGVRAGIPLLDPIAALMVAGFMGRAGFQIATTTARILSDQSVLPEAGIEHVVTNVPGVIGCHQIRTRGSMDHVFLDLHVWMAPDMPLAQAHALSHVVKDRLLARYPNIADAVIHIEPPPASI